MVALTATDPRLLPGGGRRRPPFLALPRGSLRARDQCATLVRARAVRVNNDEKYRLDELGMLRWRHGLLHRHARACRGHPRLTFLVCSKKDVDGREQARP